MQSALHELSSYIFIFTKQLGNTVPIFQMADKNSASVSKPQGPPRMLQLCPSPALAYASLAWKRLASLAQRTCWGVSMFLLPVEMQDLPLSARMYPLAQEHTTEFFSSLQNWSQSPLSRLQNFRVAVEEACWLSGQAGDSKAAACWEEG